MLYKMTLSYSGIVNYGKATLPTADSWGQQMIITRDPPKSIHTRMKTRVGDTSSIAATLAKADDRFCDSINYYARGQNPMVSVSYGESNGSSSGQAYLPYRVARDGAFRPPTWRQEDLLPLSRLPRHRTSVNGNLTQIDYTRRLTDCGGDITKEVRENLMRTSCETKKRISADPNICTPITTLMTKERLPVSADKTNLSFGIYGGECSGEKISKSLVCSKTREPLRPSTTSNKRSTVGTYKSYDYANEDQPSGVKSCTIVPTIESVDYASVLPKTWRETTSTVTYNRLPPSLRARGGYISTDRSRID